MSYANFTTLERYLEGFATNYYGSSSSFAGTISINTSLLQDDVNSSFNRINSYLDTLQRIPVIPIGTNSKTGSYHEILQEWNAKDAIFTKLKARHSEEFSAGLPQWMLEFGSRCREIFMDIADDRIALDTDTTNRGIGIGIRVAGTGNATMYSNWDSGYFTGSDFDKIFHFKVTDLTGGSNIGQAQFQRSEDDGVSYIADKYTTATTWIDIKNGLNIRWSPSAGTNSQFFLNDEWKVECIPINTRNVSSASKFRTFERG